MENARIRILELRSVRGTGGGPEKTILLGAALRDRSRFDVTVCYIRDDRDQVFGLDQRAAGLDVDYVEVRERHSFDLRVWPQLKRLVRDRRIDIVHGHEYKTDALALLLARRLPNVIPLATAHAWTGQTTRERRIYYPIDKILLARFPRVIAVSTEIKEELIRTGSRGERITVLLNSIDARVFRRRQEQRDRIRTSLGCRPDDFVIGAVGRLEPQKRFDLLLDAVAMLPKEKKVRLIVVGDGSLRNELAGTAARLGLTGRCQFLGHREDIVDLHHAFDLYVQSSEYEGTPNSVLEAMAMETPLVATDVGGTRELAQPGIHGIIVPKHDATALCRAIEAAEGDPDATRMRAQAARQRVESELTFEARTRQLERIYTELVERARELRHA